MSEVQRYNFGIEIEGCYSQYAGEEAPQGEYVKFTDFDRVTAERDALQQRLTAADERNDEAIDLLRRARAVIEGGGWADLERDIAKFLKP